MGDKLAQRHSDNLHELLSGNNPAWIPFTLDVGACSGLSAPISRQFHERTRSNDYADYFDLDFRIYSLETSFGGEDPSTLHPNANPGTTFDAWGIGHWAGGMEGTLDRMYPPLATAESAQDVDILPLPKIDSNGDASIIEDFHAAGYPVFGYAGSIYEWSWWLRGMEQFMIDLAENSSLAEAIIRKVELHTTNLALATARLGVDVLCMYDDAGTQRGLQISPLCWRRYIKPAWQRVLATVRREFPHVRFFFHSCGKIETIVPDVIELGFDILHPLQPECINFSTVYKEYGKEIVLCATVSSQQTLPFGTPEEVRREVRKMIEVVGKDRRCILMPSNVIQPETPWENIIALTDEIQVLRRLAIG